MCVRERQGDGNSRARYGRRVMERGTCRGCRREGPRGTHRAGETSRRGGREGGASWQVVIQEHQASSQTEEKEEGSVEDTGARRTRKSGGRMGVGHLGCIASSDLSEPHRHTLPGFKPRELPFTISFVKWIH